MKYRRSAAAKRESKTYVRTSHDEFLRRMFNSADGLPERSVRALVANPSNSPGALPYKGKDMPILVVDDNAELALAVAELLRLEFPQHALDVGHDGAHALRLAQARRPHVVVMDLEMPTMGGVESACEMRRRMPHPPRLTLIAMTGNPQAFDSDEARGAFDYMLDKPLDFDRLIALVAAA